MTGAQQQQMGRGFGGVASAARSHLCEVDESAAVRDRHLAALLAFAPGAQWTRDALRITFGDKATAVWVSESLAATGVSLLDVPDGALVIVPNVQSALGRYGFRGGRWVFGQGSDAALGIGRGAIHAASRFGRRGMNVACPSTPLMLTLTAVLCRLGITAAPTGGQPRVTVRPGDLAVALDRLGLAEVAVQYQQAMAATAPKEKP
ncbi:hypothetical protein BKG82_12815 [Mycobacteroides chelonae]|uniref:Uncharacterized protein n=1 Tax=Mycobacteroides chelonae TaxID=1774 RepID=A0A1S1LTR5_MYCCH|nr:hypothetical protein [Mycobacteroides chelonae]OHU57068.1 hypothetical protein BKG82_12815 [Mycobacteroides chelonae]